MDQDIRRLIIGEAVKILGEEGKWAHDRVWGTIGEHVCWDLNECLANLRRLTTMCLWTAVHAAAARIEPDKNRAFELGDTTVVYLAKELGVPSHMLWQWHDGIAKQEGLRTLQAIITH